MLRAGYAFREEFVDPMHPTEDFLRSNPLGLVPVLLREKGDPIVDSPLILDYLDEFIAPVWPKDPEQRLAVRAISALCAGTMGAAVSYFFETQKSSPDPGWVQDHLDVVPRTLAEIERRLRDPNHLSGGGVLTQAGWDLAVALEYLDLRMPMTCWREACPSLLPILGEARASRYFAETSPSRS